MTRATTISVPENRVFHDVWNTSATGLRGAVPQLQRILPKGWNVNTSPSASQREPSILFCSPDGRVTQLRVVARHRFEPRDVAGAVANIGTSGKVHRPLLVAATFLSPRTRSLLAVAGASYVDTTGNLRLALDRPSVFVERAGADRDPARRLRPLISLRGATAGRVVRALSDFRPPYGVRELARRAAIPVASVSRVLSLLERDAIVMRGTRGEVVQIDRQALLMRRAADATARTCSSRS